MVETTVEYVVTVLPSDSAGQLPQVGSEGELDVVVVVLQVCHPSLVTGLEVEVVVHVLQSGPLLVQELRELAVLDLCGPLPVELDVEVPIVPEVEVVDHSGEIHDHELVDDRVGVVELVETEDSDELVDRVEALREVVGVVLVGEVEVRLLEPEVVVLVESVVVELIGPAEFVEWLEVLVVPEVLLVPVEVLVVLVELVVPVVVLVLPEELVD